MTEARDISSRWWGPAGIGGADQLPLGMEEDKPILDAFCGRRAIEDDAFPFELFSEVAEAESWRKEINRPTTHIHKWWAQRLGTVFRAMAISTFAPSGANVYELFYKPVRAPDAVVFDPFMGSGTTIAEVLKLGGRAMGRGYQSCGPFYGAMRAVCTRSQGDTGILSGH